MKNRCIGMNFLKGVFFLTLIALLPLFSAAQVDVHVTILPPYSNKLSDYLSRPQQLLIMVHNSSTITQNVQLRGAFTGDNGVAIRGNQNYKSSAPLRLSPGEIRNLNFGDISSLFNINQITFVGITKQQFIQDNGVPEGNYQICLEAYDYYTNKPLSEASPSGCSNIFPVTSIEDPTIIAPYDGQTVSALAGQNFIISWSTPSGAPPSTQYTVKIAEIFGNQSPQEAFNTSMVPMFFQQMVTGANSLLYGTAMPAMTLGRHYAMAVTATDPTNTVIFKNNGQSVITSFIYGAPAAQSQVVAVVKDTTATTSVISPVPVNTLSGSIGWYYLQSEQNPPPGRAPVLDNYPQPELPGSIEHKVANASISVNIQPVYGTMPSGNTGPTYTPPVDPSEGGKGGKGHVAMVVSKRPAPITAADTVYQGGTFTAATDANGNFQVPINGVTEGLSQNTQAALTARGLKAPDSVIVNISVPRTWGTGTATFGPYYFPVGAFANGAALTLGTLRANALTFRFRPIVTDQSGNELTDAVINVYRRSDFYTANPQLADEGNLNADAPSREQDNIDGVMYTKIATLNSGYAATRLFFLVPTDAYKIQVSEGNHVPVNTDLTLTGVNANLTGYTIPATYALQNLPTVFSGTVYKNVSGIKNPAVGAVISLLNNLHLFTGTTDSLGNFSISMGYSIAPAITHDVIAPIATSPAPQAFLVQYKGQTISDNIVMDKPYQAYTKQEVFNLDAIAVKGVIVDQNSVSIPNPLVRWASGGSYITADAQGAFTTYNTEGTDTLIITKAGYANKHVPVRITNGLVYAQTGNPAPAAVTTRNRFSTLTPVSPGTSSMLLNAINGNIGNIMVDLLTATMTLVVQNGSGSPVANAIINIEGFPDQQSLVTDASGRITVTGPAGALVFDVQGPANSSYVPTQFGETIYADGVMHTYTFTIQAGIKLNGTVTANGAPVANATVGIQNQDFGTATTAADGSYNIILPPGNYPFEASKQGFLADIKTATYNNNQTVNFSLTTSSLNINKLLGFNVQVDVLKDNGSTKLITGEFINLPSNPVFTVSSTAKIRFTDVAVTVQPDKTIVPVDNVILTNQQTLDMKVFGYLPVTLSNEDDDNHNDAVYIQKTNGDHGQIIGTLGINFSGFLPSGFPPYAIDGFPVSNTSQTTNEVAALTDDGSVSGNTALTLLNAGEGITFNVYGFKFNIDYANSVIKSDGIHIAGSVDLTNIPVLAGTKLSVQNLWIGTDATFKGLTAQPNLNMNIAGWNAQVQSLSLSQNGFTLGGNLAVQLPSTQGTTAIQFNNLQLAPNALFGGSFIFPKSGINVFGVANVTGSNISFGQLGNSNVYYLSGAGAINFTGIAASYIDPVELDAFQVQTNGQLAITATPNLHNSFFGGVADLNVTQLSVNDVNGPGRIDLQGNFSLNIPDVSATVGGIHFSNSGVSVDNLGIEFEIAGVAKANVNVAFQNTSQQKGFSGSGSFDVFGFADIDCNFHYFKVSGGNDVGTTFSASTQIPLGASGLFITQLGGGFNVNTGKNTWDVDINGTVAVSESSFANAKIDFNIANGPKITGSAILSIATLSNVASGQLTIDVPGNLFTVDIAAGINLAGLSENAGGRLVLSLNPADKYFLLGTYANFDAFGLLKFNGSACLAYNLNTVKHANDLGEYISAIPAFARNSGQLFTGVSTLATFNYSLDNILPNFDVNLGLLDFGVHSYFDIDASGYVLAALVNNSSPTFGVGFNVDWRCGGSVDFRFADIFNEDVGLAVAFNAGFNGTVAFNPSYLAMQATAGAYFHAYWGDIAPNVCESGTNIPFYNMSHWWVSLCVNPQLTVGYDSRKSGFYAHF